jgi:hypothetical protein
MMPANWSMNKEGALKMFRTLTLVAALFLFSLPVMADSTTYTYTGNPLSNSGNPNTSMPGGVWQIGLPPCGCSIDGYATFAEPLVLPSNDSESTGELVPESYSFSVDGYTLTQDNSRIAQFGFGFLGELQWGLQIQGNNGLTISTVCEQECGDAGGAVDWAGFGGHDNIGLQWASPGVWSLPEPQSFVLLFVGLIVIAGRRHWKLMQRISRL